MTCHRHDAPDAASHHAGANISAFGDRRPRISSGAFVATNAMIIGDVEIADQASIWFGAVLRGDDCPIRIGKGSNIQDGSIIHGDEDRHAIIGDGVTIGHGAIIHGCTIRDGALVGIGAIVLDGAIVGEEALIGAGALVTPGKIIEPRTLWLGSPARKARDLSPDDIDGLRHSAEHYQARARLYLSSR
jgi:gamma-carbonic anhydrase